MLISEKNARRKSLRKILRAKRRNLSLSQQKIAKKNLTLNIIYFFKKNARNNKLKKLSLHIGSYTPADGEIQTDQIHHWCKMKHYKLHLPILKGKELAFGSYSPQKQNKSNKLTRKNHYGIAEPYDPFPKKAQALDVIFMPLVGFTAKGDRLGMGGGFYDRSLARLREHKKKPLLIGLAHSCQEVAELDVASWDYPLDYIITDKRIYSAKT